jgi:hypothetical protein
MSRIEGDMLSHTLNVMALAREAALARGRAEQAQALAPVVDGLRSLVTASSQAPAARAAPGSGAVFQDMLAALQSSPLAGPAERCDVVAAMAAGGMADLDIARHLGMTQEEVRLIVFTRQSAAASGGVR